MTSTTRSRTSASYQSRRQECQCLFRLLPGVARQEAARCGASPTFEQAIKLDPRNPTFYTTRSHAYYEKRDYERAIADLTQAIRLDPKSTLTLYNRAMAYRAKGEPDRAVPDFDRC